MHGTRKPSSVLTLDLSGFFIDDLNELLLATGAIDPQKELYSVVSVEVNIPENDGWRFFFQEYTMVRDF